MLLLQVGEGAFAPLRVVDNTPSSNLPVRPTRLIGRIDDLDRARRLLAEHRLVNDRRCWRLRQDPSGGRWGEAELLATSREALDVGASRS